ncbi:unnamed protein product [Bursaphelenchus okinawaensis]|uniref:PXA domain-containing protein n=1 Tax=Bursaphelenchus okinawaensis TaxID=465554 RepID=A0A811K6E7_9BILA|nr:unnamed protein product [Bursaphelenchus okinawaensis]CAG9092402.1 unnamed protein product [Bursaphelenchus okinawaensis]
MEMNVLNLKYLLIVSLLCVLFYNWIVNLLIICFVLILAVTGFILSVFYIGKYTDKDVSLNIVEDSQFRSYLEDFVEQKRTYLSDRIDYFVVTGSPQLDDLIHQILDNLIKSYIDPWYTQLSKNRSFPNSLKRCACRALAVLSERLKRVDWTVLLTRQLVDDVASHFRLFRLARERRMEQEQKVKDGLQSKAEDIESIFFDLELEMEVMYCRDLISTSLAYESACLHDLTDILLFLLMPSEDFRSRPLRFLIREILIGRVIVPLLNKICDPTFINSCIMVMLSDVNLTADDFLMVVQRCRSIQDLEVILEAAFDEKSALCSRDNSTQVEDIKKEIQALTSLIDLIKRRMKRLQETVVKAEEPVEILNELIDSDRVILPITVVLTNVTAVTFFSDYLASVGYQHYLDCYLAIEGFKSSVAHQLRAMAGGVSRDPDFQETMKEASLFLYSQYLADNAPRKVPLDDVLVNTFLVRMRNDEPSDSWFDHIQTEIINMLLSEKLFYIAFTQSEFYDNMLRELEISNNIEQHEDHENMYILPKGYRLVAEVEMLGVGRQNKVSGVQFYAVYNVRVTRASDNGEVISSWNVIRRYSDFYNFNSFIQNKYPSLRKIDFPGKKTFNNLKQKFLEKRCKDLNGYMQKITSPVILSETTGLLEDLLDFLNQKTYMGMSPKLPKKIVTAMVTPIMDKVRAIKTVVTNVPDQMSKMGNEINRAASSIMRSNSNVRYSEMDLRRVAATLDLEGDDESIPLRVLLLLVNELFGLDGRNQWFKSRVIAAVRHFLHAAFGTSLNRSIISFVEQKTSEQNVAKYLTMLRNNLQTHKRKDQHKVDSTKTRILSQTLMFAALPPELKFVFGSSSSLNAVSNLSTMIRQRSLNRRLCYVLLERLLLTLFPEGNFPKVLAKLHSKSPRFVDA